MLLIAIVAFLTMLFSETVGMMIVGVLIILFTYVISGTSYSLVNDYLMDKK